MFLCLSLGLVLTTGCGGEKKEEKKEEQKTTKGDEKGSAAKGSTGKEDDKKAEEKGSEKKADDKKASTDKGSEAQLVSLKLPNMTWGGCEKSVRSALTADAGFANLKTDLKSRSATFECSNADEIKKKLETIAAKNSHVRGFEIN